MGTRRGDARSSRLRRRFILTATGAFSVALAVVCAAINLWSYHLVCQRADDMIDLIYENGEAPSEPSRSDSSNGLGLRITAETPFRTRYFVVAFDEAERIVSLDSSHIAAIDHSGMASMTHEILELSQRRGFQGAYRFARFDEDGLSTIIVLDCTGDLDFFELFRNASVAVCATCVVIALVLLVPLSRRAVRPFADNLERQRRFVTDASHELKTPVAIISANNDLTERLGGPTQWTESTRRQIERIDGLVRDLVELSRADEPLDEAAASRVDLSRVASEACDDIAPLALASGKSLSTAIGDAVCVTGIEAELKRLVGALLDNAVKYCTDEGPIRLELRGTGRRALLVVSNPCSNLSPDDVDHVFDRFYRSDPSRTRSTGSYGVGLSLARAIARKHGGDIRAKLEGGSVSFLVTLPLCRP